MPNRILLLLCALLCLDCSNQEVKYINPNKLLSEYHGAQPKKVQFQRMAAVWRANVDSLSSELQAAKNLSPAQRAQREQQLAQYQQAVQQKAYETEQRLNQEVLGEINTFLKAYGEREGYGFILGATENGNIVYAAPEKDITEQVLKELNAEYDKHHTPH